MIRAMQPTDIPHAAAWIPCVPLWERYGVTEAQIRAQLEQAFEHNDLLLVHAQDGEANGIVWWLPRGAFGRSAYIRLLGVRNGSTGAGIGAALLAETEKRIRETCRELFLLVSDFNHSAQHFYQQQGYKQAGALPGYVLPDVTELIFWKSLHTD